MSDVSPYFSVTLVVFAVYLLMALLGSRERKGAAPHRIRKLRRRLRAWVSERYSRREFS